MCTLNEAGRKSICAGVCELRPVREGQGLGKSSKLRRQTGWWSKEHRHRAKKRVMGMLRITIAETLSEQRWTLEGRVVQRRRGTHRHRYLHPGRGAQHREEKVESSAVRKGVGRE